MLPKVIVIVGPTASGKSALAVRLARKFNGEVISADSRQVYKGLDIGTGKITKREMKSVPHHLLDVVSPKKLFTAAEYVKKARKAHASILPARAGGQNDKTTIICGGTGFYIDAFLGRITLPEVPPNPRLRKKLEKMSAPKLFELLKRKDPTRSAAIDRHNPRRLVRALEIAYAIGKNPLPSRDQIYDALWIGILWPQKELDMRIKKRLVARIKGGMLAEARRLHKTGLSYKRMEALGLEYRSMARHLRGKISKQEMTNELLRDIRRYSKKQMMYWNRNPNILWINPRKTSAIEKIVADFLR